jgi:hypothetical protein
MVRASMAQQRSRCQAATRRSGQGTVKVIDPTSLRFEGFVSADSIGAVHRPGGHVPAHGFEGKNSG